jgi:hypothetical protein
MIINKYSVLMIFMASLGLVLAAVLAATALVVAVRIRRSRSERDDSLAERFLHLATLVATVCLPILILNSAIFYATLASFVPEVPGAMCIYGVTRVMPSTTVFIQIAVPIAIFVLGAWLLLEHARRQSGTRARRLAGIFVLVFTAGLVAAVNGAELYYVFSMNSLNEVSCCSRGGEQSGPELRPAAYYLPWDMPAADRRTALSVVFFTAVPFLALWLLWRTRSRVLPPSSIGMMENGTLLIAAIGLAFVSVLAFSEVLSPLLMRLPFHHCVYCLLSNGQAPDAPLIVGNLAIGIFAAGWAAILGATSCAEPPPAATLQLNNRLCRIGMTTLLASELMVAIHLAI